jgi:hypothetical protein
MNPQSTQEKATIRPHRCPKCALGFIVPTSKDGRFFEFKETVINLPMSVYIPTCGECGAEFHTPEVLAEIKAALESEYKRDEAEIAKTLERLRRRKGIN